MVPQLSAARISIDKCPVKLEPNHACESSSELLFGELVLVLEQDAQWCKIKSAHDRYEGYIETAVCDFSGVFTTHMVSTKATFIFEHPDIKSPVKKRLLFGSELTLSDDGQGTNFLKMDQGGFVWAANCREKNTPLESSMVELAKNNYLHAPYLWGGRSSDGCDCSGLVQMVAMASGVNMPRDSGDQEAALSSHVHFDSRAAEDLVYWPGHVGILESPDMLMHSTAHSMRCCIEPLSEVIARAGSPSSIKRISSQ